MYTFKRKKNFLNHLKTISKTISIGFVPTMGALHKGHLKLIEMSKAECEVTICSIFVNPTQFDNNDDLTNYPNTLITDLENLKKVKCDIVYVPEVDDVYNVGEEAKKFNFGTLTTSMEGSFRPGHFDGMATIVEKFFKIIKPTTAFFGEKDLQQLQIVKALIKKTNLPIKIKGVPTVREVNGLAYSSRNTLLSKEGFEKAAIIYSCLMYCFKNKSKEIAKLKKYLHTQFKNKKSVKLEYLEFVNIKTMLPISEWQIKGNNAICIAAYVDGVRLIDNIIL